MRSPCGFCLPMDVFTANIGACYPNRSARRADGLPIRPNAGPGLAVGSWHGRVTRLQAPPLGRASGETVALGDTTVTLGDTGYTSCHFF
jgi:hypothetical protein